MKNALNLDFVNFLRQNIIKNKLWLSESSIDFPASIGLCPDIWVMTIDGTYKLKSNVKHKLNQIVSQMPQWLTKEIHIIGSLTSNLYTPDTDLDLHFVIDATNKQMPEIDKLNKILRTAPETIVNLKKDELYIGTHPIEIYIQTNRWQDLGSFGTYDFLNDTWLTGPEIFPQDYDPIEEFSYALPQVTKYAKMISFAFETAKMAIIDLDTIIDASKQIHGSNKFKTKITKAEKRVLNALKEIVEIKAKIVNLRKRTSQPKNKDEAVKMKKSKQWKTANAVVKFLNRYNYLVKASKIEQELNTILELKSPVSSNIDVARSILLV